MWKKSLLVLAVFIQIACNYESCAGSKFQPPRVILDADIDSDVDDVGALAMLLNLHKNKVINLIGVVVTSDDPYAPRCAAAINAFYGFPEIPVGFLKGQSNLSNHSRYTKQIATEFCTTPVSHENFIDAAKLYRSLLAKSPKESVTILTIGHLSSLQALLKSKADDVSSLDGINLVKKKVKDWICMGGQFPSGKEANFYRPDPQSTFYCIQNWNKRVVFCGWEAGNKVITGGKRLKEEFSPKHPVYRAYELYNNFAGRSSWDQIAVLQLIDIKDEFFFLKRGTCMIADDGSNTWSDDKTGKHYHIVIQTDTPEENISEYIDKLMAGRMK